MKQRTPAETWLRTWRTAPHATSRLVVFPHAGGSASFYRGWCDALPETVDVRVVQYPGREDRFNDSCAENLHALASEIANAVAPMDDLPIALFGHSMGAIVAYEVALRLESAHTPHLLHLFVSGRRAPHRRRGGCVHLGDEESLLAELTRVGGTPKDVLEYPEMRELVLPSVRDDYRLIETYDPYAGGRLSCPITAFIGDRDTEAGVDETRAWAEHTLSSFRLSIFPGDHFYLVPQRQELVREILGNLPTRPIPKEPSPTYRSRKEHRP